MMHTMLMRHAVIYSFANTNQVKFRIYKIEAFQINKPYYIYIAIVYNITLYIIV